MASYKDYLNGVIAITDATISKAVSWLSAAANKRLKRIQSQGWTYVKADSLGSTDSETIAGHKKFGAKGKSKQELYAEFKRLKDFFSETASSVGGVRKQAKEFKVRAEELRSYRQLEDLRKKRRKLEKEHPEVFVEYEPPMSKKELKDFEQAKKAENKRAERTGDYSETYDGSESKRDWYAHWIDGLRLYTYLLETGLYKASRKDSDQMRAICYEVAAAFGNTMSLDELADIAFQRYAQVDSGFDYGDIEDEFGTSQFFTTNR